MLGRPSALLSSRTRRILANRSSRSWPGCAPWVRMRGETEPVTHFAATASLDDKQPASDGPSGANWPCRTGSLRSAHETCGTAPRLGRSWKRTRRVRRCSRSGCYGQARMARGQRLARQGGRRKGPSTRTGGRHQTRTAGTNRWLDGGNGCVLCGPGGGRSGDGSSTRRAARAWTQQLCPAAR